MSTLPPPRFEHGRPMLLAGVRRHHTFAEMATSIPRQWQDFLELGQLPGQAGSTAYGAICGGDPKAQTMEYLCGVEVRSFDGLPASLGRMRIPAARYAVFVHEGNVATIQQSWGTIFNVWLPQAGLRSGNTPDFELYDERFDAATGDGGVEIWLSVLPAE